MLESLQDRGEASYLVTELVQQIMETEFDVTAKLRYVQKAINYAKDDVEIDDAKALRSLLLNPAAERYLLGAKFNVHDGSYLFVSKQNTERQLSAVMSYVAASGLIFAHSFLEYALETELRITRLCDINSWLQFFSGKPIQISKVLEVGLEPAIETKLEEYVTALQKESILTKIDHLARLLRKSITKSSVVDYAYDPDRMRKLDKLRHELAHQRKSDYGIDAAENDIIYLCRTAFHFLDLVVHHYDLRGAHRPKHSRST